MIIKNNITIELSSDVFLHSHPLWEKIGQDAREDIHVFNASCFIFYPFIFCCLLFSFFLSEEDGFEVSLMLKILRLLFLHFFLDSFGVRFDQVFDFLA